MIRMNPKNVAGRVADLSLKVLAARTYTWIYLHMKTLKMNSRMT